jgi:hypothetical protein
MNMVDPTQPTAEAAGQRQLDLFEIQQREADAV